MSGKAILIVDDDADVLGALRALLEDDFDTIVTEGNPSRIHSLVSENYDVILLDMNFSAGVNTGNEGLFWLTEILRIRPEAAVILMTAYGNIDLAVEALKRGARDFVLKPWDNEKMVTTVRACLKKKVYSQQSPLPQGEFLRGTSPMMVDLYQQIEKVAPTDASVLILGENGTGKEVVAREIHRLSTRRNNVFLSVDMTTLPAGLFESELFGHKKGAFTDARADRKGRFESADGGTLFLDEIGNLPLDQQAKLLTVLQTRTVTPVGSNAAVPFNVRLICATNASLPALSAREGAFRQDLLYRINTITLHVPPLRDRVGDILPLAEHFLEVFAQKYNRQTPKLSDGAREGVLSYSWPGNVRELQHTMEKAIILSSGGEITLRDLSLYTSSNPVIPSATKTLDDIEREALVAALGAYHGNVLQAAKALGITRQTLYNKMKKYGL